MKLDGLNARLGAPWAQVPPWPIELVLRLYPLVLMAAGPNMMSDWIYPPGVIMTCVHRIARDGAVIGVILMGSPHQGKAFPFFQRVWAVGA